MEGDVSQKRQKCRKGNVPNATWRRVKQFLFVMNVEMSLVNG